MTILTKSILFLFQQSMKFFPQFFISCFVFVLQRLINFKRYLCAKTTFFITLWLH